jgi:hypothetical protein
MVVSHETEFHVFAVALIMACVEVQDKIQYWPASMFVPVQTYDLVKLL